jgi:hypothetical protein
MCTGVEIAALVASAVGTGASVYSQQDALRQQDRAAAQGIIEQSALQRQAQSRVDQNIQQLAASNPDAERAKANQDFISALQASKLTKGGAGLEAGPGATSQRFAEDVGGAQKAAGAENVALAGNLARIDAPTFQRLREGQAAAATASDLGLLTGQSQAQDYLNRLRIGQITANPWLNGGGQMLASFGNAMAARAPGGKLPVGSGGPLFSGTPSIPGGLA